MAAFTEYKGGFFLLGILGVLIVLGGLIGSYVEGKRAASVEFFSKALAEAQADEVVMVGGESVRVKDGVVQDGALHEADVHTALRLAYEKTLARRDPLLAIAGTDPDAMLFAARELQVTADVLASLQKDPSARRYVSAALYPVDFIVMLAELERTRLSFLTLGDEASVRTYNMNLRNTLAAYHRDLERFRRAFEAVVPHEANAFATEAKIISREGVVRALDSLDDRGEALAREFHRRERCFSGAIEKCTPLAYREVRTERTESDEQALKNAETVSTLLNEAAMLEGERPRIELSQSVCVPPKHNTALVFALDRTAARPVVFVGDLRLIRTDQSDIPFLKYFRDRGAKYVQVGSFLYYQCPEFGKDIGAVFALGAIREFARSTPFTRAGVAAPELEERVSSMYVREAEALAYLEALKRLNPDEAASLTLQFRNRSTAFDQVLMHIVRIERANAARTDGPYAELQAEYLFYVRNALPTLFFAHDAAVPMPALFPPFTGEHPFVYFSDLVSDPTFEIETLLRDMRIYAETKHAAPNNGNPL